MAEYFSPGVFIEDSANKMSSIEGVSASVGGFVGIAQRGVVKTPVLLTSWNAFINNFARGMTSPFIASSDLAYSVYGFFQNGGSRCYVVRTASETAAKATTTGESTPIIKAKEEGTWGNSLKLSVAANADIETNFDLTVKLGTEVVETIEDLCNTATDEKYWVDKVNASSNYVTAVSGTLAATAEDLALSTGADGVSDIADTDYEDALTSFNAVSDVNMICMPGQTAALTVAKLVTYCENRADVFALIECPKTNTVAEALTLRKGMSCSVGALLYPWIKVSDPLSKVGKLRECPPCGHVMGVYARTVKEYGVWKAPAGVEAVVRGALDVVTQVTSSDTETLNPAGVVSIMPKTNYGIVIWGARSLSADSTMRYVSDILLNTYIKKSVYQGTQQFVFEPHDSALWNRVKITIQAFLDSLWREGGLFGDSASEAYYVKCDGDLNTSEVRNQGKLICEVGYAGKKPAEFIIFRFSHQLES